MHEGRECTRVHVGSEAKALPVSVSGEEPLSTPPSSCFSCFIPGRIRLLFLPMTPPPRPWLRLQASFSPPTPKSSL